MKIEVKKALSFIETAQQYLELCSNTSKLIVKHGNTDLEGIDENGSVWTDYYLAIPVLFNFYHGLELYFKGLIIVEGVNIQNHKLTELMAKVKELHPDGMFLYSIEKYISTESSPPIISKFLNSASIQIDDWYQAFKYPESTKGKTFDHYDLQFTGSEGVQLFSNLVSDIKAFKEDAVKYLSPKYEWWA